MGSPTRLTVPEALDGARVDLVLARLAGLSRSEARRLIEDGRVGQSQAVGGRSLRPGTRLAVGDQIVFHPRPVVGPQAWAVDLDVRYEDCHLAVISKPPGMLTHPAPRHLDKTLVSALLNKWPQIEGVGESPRWGIVHRLDKDTSGAMIIALHPDAHQGLTEAIAQRRVARKYLALVYGVPTVGRGTVEAPISSHRGRRRVSAEGRAAVTHYRMLLSWKDPEVSLLEVTLETGRTHQIRVHLGAIAHPVVGDPVYGWPGPHGLAPKRQWLHAHSVSFAHPVSGTRLRVSAPLAPDLRPSLEALGGASTAMR